MAGNCMEQDYLKVSTCGDQEDTERRPQRVSNQELTPCTYRQIKDSLWKKNENSGIGFYQMIDFYFKLKLPTQCLLSCSYNTSTH